MSEAILEETRRLSQSRGHTRLVLLELARWASTDSRQAWPTVRRIARDTGLSVRQVRNELRRLEQLGEIRAVDGSKGGGRGRATVYEIDPARPRQLHLPTGPEMSKGGTQCAAFKRSHAAFSDGEKAAPGALKAAEEPRASNTAFKEPKTETHPPIAPPRGGSSRRRSRGNDLARPPAPCPLSAAEADRMLATWEPHLAKILAGLSPRAELLLEGLHPHGSTDDRRLVLGIDPGKLGWVQRRYPAMIERVLGGPVLLVACDGIPEESGS